MSIIEITTFLNHRSCWLPWHSTFQKVPKFESPPLELNVPVFETPPHRPFSRSDGIDALTPCTEALGSHHKVNKDHLLLSLHAASMASRIQSWINWKRPISFTYIHSTRPRLFTCQPKPVNFNSHLPETVFFYSAHVQVYSSLSSLVGCCRIPNVWWGPGGRNGWDTYRVFLDMTRNSQKFEKKSGHLSSEIC